MDTIRNRRLTTVKEKKAATAREEGKDDGGIVTKCPVCNIQFITSDEVVACINGHVFHTLCFERQNNAQGNQ